MRNFATSFLVGMAIFFSFPVASGAQWVEVGSPKGGWITSMAVSGTNLFVSTRKGGVFLSTDNGASWNAVNSGLPKKTDFQCLAVIGSNLFAGSMKRGVFLSMDNGANWTAVNSGLPTNCSVLRLAVIGTNLFAVAGVKDATVFLSTDNGASWKPASSGLTDTHVWCLAVIGANLFAGTGTLLMDKIGGVFLSTDNGASWKAVNSGLSDKMPIFRLAVSGTNLFAGTYWAGRVFLSVDNGASWTLASSGLPDPIDFSLSDFAVSETSLFLGGVGGAYLSTDNGTSWTAINAGLPEKTDVWCLAMSKTDLFAGSEDGKVWRLPLSDVSLAVNLSEPVLSEQQWAVIRKSSPKAVFIPKEIKALMQEGLATRQGRRDIPFTIFKYLFLPAQNMPGIVLLFDISTSRLIAVTLPEKVYASNDFLHAVLFFRAKNADLGYAIESPAPAPKQGEKAPPASASVHKAHLNVFIEFRQTDETGASKVVREVYVPATLEEVSATYDPDKENWYSVGYTLRPGKYTVVMAITRETIPSTKNSAVNDLQKVGIGYLDIDLPGPESYQTALETTSVLFVKKVEQIKDADVVTSLHKCMFTCSNAQVVPDIEYVVSPGELSEISYYVFGAKPKAEPGLQAKYDIESAYEVQKEDGTVAILWKAQNYDFAGINQPLVFKQTVMIKDDKGERQEQRDLAVGKYSLVIKVKDKVSGLMVEKKVPFEVK